MNENIMNSSSPPLSIPNDMQSCSYAIKRAVD